ncbi:MAG TPA: polysaccharide deacetylase family protein [Bryobacteraceae bacterium]|nr:polysaccharide deacetylase family protein [Bryobacteraceae bacterium]
MRTAKAGGLFRRSMASTWRNERLLILCYHGISLEDEHLWNPGLYIDRATFRARMQMLRDSRSNILPLDEALVRLERGTLPPRSVALTFDDGSHDMCALAVPILREFQFPATVYLTTYYCRHQLPVFDTICSYLIWKSRGKTLLLDGILPEGGTIHLAGDAEWRNVFQRIWRHVRVEKMSAAAKDDLAEQLATRLGIDYAEIRRRRLLYIMNAEEASAIARQGISLELHTHRHMVPRNRDLFMREIRDNEAEICNITGGQTVPRHFCYPSGDYLPEFGGWLRELGVRSAATCDAGLVSRADDPMLIPRLLDAPSVSEVDMESWLAGFTPWLRWRTGHSAKMNNPYFVSDPRQL